MTVRSPFLALLALAASACAVPPAGTAPEEADRREDDPRETPAPASVGEIPPLEVTLREPARGPGTMTARVPGTDSRVEGVRLAAHHVRATTQAGFAHTEIEEVFQNDTNRVLEGRLVLPVPAAATVARLACGSARS